VQSLAPADFCGWFIMYIIRLVWILSSCVIWIYSIWALEGGNSHCEPNTHAYTATHTIMHREREREREKWNSIRRCPYYGCLLKHVEHFVQFMSYDVLFSRYMPLSDEASDHLIEVWVPCSFYGSRQCVAWRSVKHAMPVLPVTSSLPPGINWVAFSHCQTSFL
jgi:hypothetical protein